MFFCAALRRNTMLGAMYAWIRLGQSPPEWWKREAGVDTHDCTNDELKRASQGYLAVDRDTLGLPDTVMLPKAMETASRWRQRYTTRSGAAGISGFGPAAYDAVWAWAWALHKLVEVEKQPVASLTRDAAGLSATKAALLGVSFNGASGPVSFDSKGDRQGITLKIENQVDGVEKKVSRQTETPTY